MNTSKKVSWHLAAVTAAALLGSGAAMADGRGHGHDGHDRNRGESVHREYSQNRGQYRSRGPEQAYWYHEGRDERQAARWHRHWHDYDRYDGYYAPLPLPPIPLPPFIGRLPFGIR